MLLVTINRLVSQKSITYFGVECCPPLPDRKRPTKTQSNLPTAPKSSIIVFKCFAFTFYIYISPHPLLSILFSVKCFTYCLVPLPLLPLSPRLIVCHHVMSVCHVNVIVSVSYCHTHMSLCHIHLYKLNTTTIG